MTPRSLTRRFVLLRGLRWLPLGLGLPFFILLPQDRGLGLGTIGAVWSVHSVVTLLLEVPSGALADAVGRRRTLLAGAALTALGMGAYGLATAIAGFMAAVAAIAVGRALISGSLEAWFVDALREMEPDADLRRPMAAGSTVEALSLGAGAIVGGLLPLLVAGLPDTGDDRLLELSIPMLAGAAAGLGYLVAVWAYVVEPARPRPETWRDAAGDAVAMARHGLGEARRSHNVRLLLGLACAIGLVMCATELLWQPRLADILETDTGDAAPLFGALSAASMLAAAAGAAVSPRLARGRGPRRAYVGAMLAVGAMIALLAAVHAVVLFCAVYLVFYWALGVTDPLHVAMLHEAIEGPARATVVSAESLTSQLGGVGGNLGLGPLAGAQGIPAAWLVASAAAFAGALLARSIRPEAAAVRPRPRPAAPSGAA